MLFFAMEYIFIILALAVTSSVCNPTRNQLVSLKTASLAQGENVGIFHGQTTTIQKHPSIVAIIIDSQFNCEGTIVSDSWIVTLADGVYGLQASEVNIIAASNDASSGKKFQVKQIVIHPKYGTSLGDYDYACIQIKGKFKFSNSIQPIKLPSQDPKTGTKMIVAGWGETGYPGEESVTKNTLKDGYMNWFHKKKCKALYAAAGIIFTDRMACVYNKGKTTLCEGGWGDALVSKNVYYGHFIMALVDGFCTTEAQPVLLADIYSVVAWIKKVTGAKTEDEKD